MRRIGASDVVLAASMACWSACYAMLCTQIVEVANPECFTGTILLSVNLVMVSLGVVAFGFSWDKDDDDATTEPESSEPEPSTSTPTYTRSINISTNFMRVAGFALMIWPFLVLLRPQVEAGLGGALDDTCGTSVLLALLFLVSEGCAMIGLLMFVPSCSGWLRCLLAGVICTSFSKGFLHATPTTSSHYHHNYYKVLVLFLALLLIFLCDMYLSLCAAQTSPSLPPASSDTPVSPPLPPVPPTQDVSSMV